MKLAITIKGFIDVPNEWLDPQRDADFVAEVAEYRYNEQLCEDDAIVELAEKITNVTVFAEVADEEV